MSSEWFDIYDDQMNPVGQATRQETHACGYWHHTFHCWVYEKRQGEIYIAFQQRQACKDTNPLCYDITVAGHLTAGEQIHDAVREIQEEIGLQVNYEQLQHIMRVREQATGTINGQPYYDREVSDVFACYCPAPISTWQFQLEEVLAVYEAPLFALRNLFLGQILQIEVSGYIQSEQFPQNVLKAHRTIVTKDQFVPRDEQYYLQVFDAISLL